MIWGRKGFYLWDFIGLLIYLSLGVLCLYFIFLDEWIMNGSGFERSLLENCSNDIWYYILCVFFFRSLFSFLNVFVLVMFLFINMGL